MSFKGSCESDLEDPTSPARDRSTPRRGGPGSLLELKNYSWKVSSWSPGGEAEKRVRALTGDLPVYRNSRVGPLHLEWMDIQPRGKSWEVSTQSWN